MNSEVSYDPTQAKIEHKSGPRSLTGRLAGIWFSPTETCAEIGRVPRILIPTLLVLILSSASSYLLIERCGYENIVRRFAQPNQP